MLLDAEVGCKCLLSRSTAPVHKLRLLRPLNALLEDEFEDKVDFAKERAGNAADVKFRASATMV